MFGISTQHVQKGFNWQRVMKRTILAVILLFMISLPKSDIQRAFGSQHNSFMVLCYHDIPEEVKLNEYSVDQASFVEQLEYLRVHEYNIISFQDIMETNKGEKTLPDKAILITFDDAYLSFYEFVMPMLALYGYPCVLAVVTDWIDNPPPNVKETLMSWEQLAEAAKSDLVTIASHSHNLHRGVIYNPQRNTFAAAISRVYDTEKQTYETIDNHRQRLRKDLSLSRKILSNKLRISVQTLVWPYGQYSLISLEEAKKAGYKIMFTLENEVAFANNLETTPRYMIKKNPPIGQFVSDIKEKFIDHPILRIIQADLDLLYDPDPVQQEKNLDKFIERIYKIKPSTVFLQAFCDDDGDGNILSVYFPNRVLPVKSDFFNRVVNQLSIREISVYAWMPMLSIVLPDNASTPLRVMEHKNGTTQISTSWYQRLSPFSPEAGKKLVMLYEDLAATTGISGVVFQDDGYLNDFEDFHPDALDDYHSICGKQFVPYQELTPDQKLLWTEHKTRVLIELTDQLKNAVLRFRPYSQFVRTLYAPVLSKPESEEWFAQNYADSLKAYDYVMIMAYPYMEGVRSPKKWLEKLITLAKTYPEGIQKTIFKIQAYDWKQKRWIDSQELHKWLRTLVAAGASHVGYYPDNYIDNKPDMNTIRLMISTEDFPFKRE
ncbi:MAG: poly-beta-1,6-N-acetyl-D-glucosamine N-deacetylase PgaB [bacterium]